MMWRNSVARAAMLGDEIASEWHRWFAWYPVSDVGVTYWLMWVEWRRVASFGMLGGRQFKTAYLEYRSPRGRELA
jgi:hypothetical protein